MTIQTTDITSVDIQTLSWRDAYDKLKQFIGLNSGIDISGDRILIPEDVKEEFYNLFNIARASFIREYCPAVLDRGCKLSQQYKTMRAILLQATGFSNVETSSDLKWFLEDPIDGLRRFIFNPLFALLANQTGLAEFEQAFSSKINESFAALARDGYQHWVALGIIRRLLPDKSYRFPAIDALHDVLIGEGHENAGQHRGEVPEAQETEGITFEQHPVISFIVPRITVRSRRTNEYMAMHSDFREADWTARKRSTDMEWLEIGTLKTEYNLTKLRPDLIKKSRYELEPILPDLALYTAGDVNSLALVADFGYMLRPEASIVVMESADWSEISLTDLKRRLLALRPNKGAFVVCRQDIPAAVLAAFSGDDSIGLIHSDYDDEKLEPIIDILSPQS